MNHYLAKVSYIRNQEGRPEVTETYLVKAMNLTDAERLITEAITPMLATKIVTTGFGTPDQKTTEGVPCDIVVKSIIKKCFGDLYLEYGTNTANSAFFLTVYSVPSEDGKKGKKAHALIRCADFEEAFRISMFETRYDRTLLSITETDIVDLLENE